VCGESVVDVVLLVTQRQLHVLTKKLLAQPFGLKEIAKELNSFFPQKVFPLEIMGVLNINDDSFFSQSRVDPSGVIARVYGMIEEGATIIDIGAVSSRPGSVYVGVDEELARLKPVLDAVYQEGIEQKVRLSIDAFEPRVVAAALEKGFKIVNDITGLSNDETVKIAASYGVQGVMMHKVGDTQTMQHNPHYDNVILEVDHYFEKGLERVHALGLTDVVLDVGIGFGKNLHHNLSLIKNMAHFTHFGVPLLVGASRKSMINAISVSPVEKRLAGTLALHIEAVKQGASLIRCHDVYEHRQALSVIDALAKITY
jgi:dihydropteroate synthase